MIDWDMNDVSNYYSNCEQQNFFSRAAWKFENISPEVNWDSPTFFRTTFLPPDHPGSRSYLPHVSGIRSKSHHFWPHFGAFVRSKPSSLWNMAFGNNTVLWTRDAWAAQLDFIWEGRDGGAQFVLFGSVRGG